MSLCPGTFGVLLCERQEGHTGLHWDDEYCWEGGTLRRRGVPVVQEKLSVTLPKEQIRRLPEHRARVPKKHVVVDEDKFESSTTARCLLCHRRIYLNLHQHWVHVQDLRPDRFWRAKWHLATRYGDTTHFDIGDGVPACGIDKRYTVKSTREADGETGQFMGGFSSRCKKCTKIARESYGIE